MHIRVDAILVHVHILFFFIKMIKVQSIKPADLAVPTSSPARGEIFFTINGIPLPTAFHYRPHRPDMTAILLKRT